MNTPEQATQALDAAMDMSGTGLPLPRPIVRDGSPVLTRAQTPTPEAAVEDRVARAFLQRHKIIIGPEDRRSTVEVARAIAAKSGLPLVEVEPVEALEPTLDEVHEE